MAAVICSAPALAPRLDAARARAVRARVASPLTARGGVAARAVALSCNVENAGRRPPHARPASFPAAPRRRGAALTPRSTGDAAAASPSSDEGGTSASPFPPLPPPAGLIAGFVRGLRGRMAADANFPFKLGAEVTLDEFMTVLVNVGVRGNPAGWLLGDKLQVLCQMLTAAVNDIILVYCLAPVKDDGASASASAKKSDAPEIAHIFQEGDFSLAQRIGCYLAKGRFYALVGAVSCTFSMFLTLALSGQMAKVTPEYLFRALMTGALHMGISANTRYQIVNGIERVLFSILPENVAKLASVATRLSNNLLGARLWIVMTTITGLA